ncbi:LAFE_0D06810g1_1 [Lachancea fermentati]|uniref:LAFE_0D06810g1_1 n=1 Tax=Lachancea fermentati TaxID=4955 RepID=A0A1G4MB97_LACFM|nr:LAFE_0D06810g1_1 [Lachancea fermentati]
MKSKNVSSPISVVSNETNEQFLPSLRDAYPLFSNSDYVLEFTSKILLLEYINEPRFRRRFKIRNDDPSNISQKYPIKLQGKNQLNKRSSWVALDTSSGSCSSEGELLRRVLPLIEQYLMKVAMGKSKIKNEQFRRSMLKLYNDLFLNPQMSKALESMSKFEELLMLFTKAANGELLKLDTQRTQDVLYIQLSSFIDVIVQLISEKGDTTSRLVEKLQEYKTVFEPTASVSIVNSSASSTKEFSSDLGEATLKPSFKTKEITHANYLMELFNIPELEFQQHVIRYVDSVKNDLLQKELEIEREKVENDRGPLVKSKFGCKENYEIWKKRELTEIDTIIEKLEETKAGHNELNKGNISKRDKILPNNARDIFTHLLWLILKKEASEASQASSSLSFSKDASFFLLKCSKYWRLDNPSTKATLLYTAGNFGILSGTELNPENVMGLFSIIFSKILSTEEDCDVTQWNSDDQKQWLINLTFTFEQIISSLNSLSSLIYEHPRPIFSPVLRIYHSFIEADPLLIYYDLRNTEYFRKHMKILKRTLFRASEKYYLTLLQQIPKDNTIEMHHIEQIAQSILLEIKDLQKRYSKLLLGELNIAFECASVLVEAFGTDCYAMLKRVEYYFLEKNEQETINLEAIETYKILQELRDVFYQVQPSKKFPFKLEKSFVKYLSQLCDQTCDKLLQVVDNAIQAESWQQVNPTKFCSTSAIDIFKMINESIDIFTKLKWGNEYQISKIYTFILKAIADVISRYAAAVTNIIEDELANLSEEDLKEEGSDDMNDSSFIPQSAADKMRNTWLFNEMRNALKSSNLIVPKPHKFTSKTCVCLSNLEEMIRMIGDLEERINPQKISITVEKYERSNPKLQKMTALQNSGLRQLYVIKIIRAENCRGSSNNELLNSYVSFVDTTRRQDIAKTKVIPKSVNPVWNEEFEFECPINESRSLNLVMWNHKSGFGSSSTEVCGRANFSLDPSAYRDDGLPEDIILNLDTQGRIVLQVSMEKERLDALFSMGKAYRTISRARSRSIELMVDRFASFVRFAFSRSTLKTVCGVNGNKKVENEIIYDAVLPLFDYLNANLSILAVELKRDLLFKIMLETWSVILNQADSLLLPLLSDVRRPPEEDGKTKSIWESAVDVARANLSNFANFGRPLTQIEIDTVFEWLRALCIDFFHNGGEGPPLNDLKNQHYQNLLLIPIFYDKGKKELKEEVERLNPEYEQYLNSMNEHSDHAKTRTPKSRKVNTIARRKTILANSSKKRRQQLDLEIKISESNPLEISAATQDILLRILLAKGETSYVYKNLQAREQALKKMRTEMFVKAAVTNRGGWKS